MGADGLPALIDRLERDFKRGIGILVGTALYLSAFPCISYTNDIDYIARQFPALDGPGIILFLAFFLPGMVVLLAWLVAIFQGRTIASNLAGSDTLAQIISVPGRADGLRESVPGLLRNNLDYPQLPKGYYGGLAEQLWYMGYNLDWYLRPVTRLVRPAWIAGMCLLALTAITLLWTLHFPFWLVPHGPNESIVIGSLSMLCIGIAAHDVIRKHLWTKLLVRHLRELVG